MEALRRDIFDHRRAQIRPRLPGQWTQAENGLAWNWHRHYDPTTGRYTKPDPLRFVDGPGLYAYVGGNPLAFVDRIGMSYGSPLIRGLFSAPIKARTKSVLGSNTRLLEGSAGLHPSLP
ncbi:MAG: RHS repeat-associated core domain-containing protein [Rhodoblastus sp.]|nr:MAG: RHS repeat-associated core domain-containing protein [Rhodoblastus sp.]